MMSIFGLLGSSYLAFFLIGIISMVRLQQADAIAATNSNNSNRPFLDVYLRVEPNDDFCGALRCNITYAISVLTNMHNQFDLHSLMLQDGQMRRRTREMGPKTDGIDYFFEENTVVRLSDELRRSRGKVYLGVKFFDLPDDIQDYLVVEVSDAIKMGRRAKTHFESDTAQIDIQVYRRNEATTTDAEVALNSNSVAEDTDTGHHELLMDASPSLLRPPSQAHRHHPHVDHKKHGSCVCAGRNCGCCDHVAVRKIHLDDEVCVNVSYIAADIGVRLALSVDNHVYYSKELSLRNPPPACFEVPHLREYASICVRLYNLEFVGGDLTGCTEMEAILLHLRVARHRIGCFRIPF